MRCDGSSNTITVSLPNAINCEGRIYNIKAIDISNQVDIDPFGTQEIDGVSINYVFGSQNDNLQIQASNGNWDKL